MALHSICTIYAVHIGRNDTANAMNAIALVVSNMRRDYSRPPRKFALEWWTSTVPYFRQCDEARFIRNFRIPSVVMDEIVTAAELHPDFAVAARVAGRAATTSKKIHMTMWRLGRSATVTDCSEIFAVSEGFIDKWTNICLAFIKAAFAHRLWGRA